jgi:hypothetical protein
MSVWFLFIVETIITILTTIGAWCFLAVGWGNTDALDTVGDWPILPMPFLSNLCVLHLLVLLMQHLNVFLSDVLYTSVLLLEIVDVVKACDFSCWYYNSMFPVCKT